MCRQQTEQREKSDWERPTHLACYPPPPPHLLCQSISPTSQRIRMRTLGSVVLVELTQLCSDSCSQLSRFYVDFHLCAPENHVLYIWLHVVNRTFFFFFFLIFIIFVRQVNPKPCKLKTHIKRRPCIFEIIGYTKYQIQLIMFYMESY